MVKEECVHEFTYLMREYDGIYTGRVLELPPVIVSGSEAEVKQKIVDVTRDYLKYSDTDHEKAKNKELKPTLQSNTDGIVIGTCKFQVKC